MALVESRSIWLIHPYAGGPGVGRYDRPYQLAKQWESMGWHGIVLTPSEHHLLDAPRAPGLASIDGVTYNFIRAPAYEGNGLGRLINMAVFTAKLLHQADSLAAKYGRPAMVIASSPHPYCFLAAERLAHRFNCRCVFEVRDLWPLSLVELAGLAPINPLVLFTGWLERRAYRKADAVVSLLPCTREYMVDRGLEERRWKYIPNGVKTNQEDVEAENSDACKLANKWRAEGRMVVVYAGALGRPNHVRSLVSAMALQHAEGVNTAAIIVGRGEQESELKALIVQLGLLGRVAIFEQIPKRAVLTLLRQADVGFISLRPEPLFRFGVSPNKLFDYMMAGLPVLFAVQAGNDPVREAGCGYSVDPGQPEAISAALTKLASMSLTARREMGQRGRYWVERHHGYASLARDYLALAEGSN